MELYKYSTLYHFNVDFGEQVLIERMRLLFDQDDKSYKVLVRLITPFNENGEEIVYRRMYDENCYSQVAEKAYKADVIDYFSTPKSSNEVKGQSYGLNALAINFPQGYLGRYVRLQVELLDTHKSVYKIQHLTGITIKPEFYG